MKVTTIIIIILSACILYKLFLDKKEGFILENPEYKKDTDPTNDTFGIITSTNDLLTDYPTNRGYPVGTKYNRFSYYKADIKDPNVDTVTVAKNGGASCPANSPTYFPTTVYLQIPPVNATCKTSDTDLYSTSADSHSVCNTNQNNVWFKQGTRKDENLIKNTDSQYGGLTCTEQVPLNKNIQCGPIEAVCVTGDSSLYDIPTDSSSSCSISTVPNSKDWFKTATRKTNDTSITVVAAKNGGLTCTAKTPATKQIMCGKVDAIPIVPLTLTLNGQLSDSFYNFNTDSFNECSIQKSDGWYKRGTLKADSAITSSPALYGGQTVTEQINKLGTGFATKDKLCAAIPAKCLENIDNVIGNYNVSTSAVSGNQILDGLGKWISSPWAICSNGMLNRTVTCVNSSGQTVAEGTGNCTTATKPVSSQPCGPDGDNVGRWVNGSNTPNGIIEGTWQTCSGGTEISYVYCVNSSNQRVPDGTGNCTASTKPGGTAGYISRPCQQTSTTIISTNIYGDLISSTGSGRAGRIRTNYSF